MTALESLSSDVAALVARAAPAVVGVEHRRGQGSGLVLAPDGYVITNAHVARGGGPLRIRLSGSRVAGAALIGTDARTDLAVLRVEAGGAQRALSGWSALAGWADWYSATQVAKTNYHKFTCSKCHAPHNSGLNRLMVTSCLNSNHQGQRASGGTPVAIYACDQYEGSGDSGPQCNQGSFPRGPGYYTDAGSNCHPTGTWPDNSWNRVMPW